MYLNSLELQGFKSFPDRVKLEFDKGVTAVVGPNGSGKSNISDAVRWVLGEQSAKTLRGGKMEDVIFSGTQKRKAMGFACVTLNIDNSDGTISDVGDEISVTRKYYRSGESEYILNGKSVRLRDIHELFMDTGLGRDGYSIIGQGRVAEIVGARSEERRAIFEEAAGVSKFRYKKEDAVKKLDAAEENLLRLSDIADGLKDRLEPLRKQAEKAKKYLELAEKQKKCEINLWNAELDNIKQNEKEANENLVRLKNELELYDIEIEKQNTRIKQGYESIQKTDVEIENTRYDINAARKTAADAKSECAVLENEIKHSDERKLKLDAECENDKKLIQEYSEKKAEFEKECEKLKSEIKQISFEAENIENKLEEAKKESEKAGLASREISNKMPELYEKQSALRETIAKCKAFAQNAENLDNRKSERIKELTDEKSEAEKNFEISQNDLAEIENKISESEKSISEKESKNNHLAMEIKKADEKYKKLSNEINSYKQRIHILSDMEKNMEGFSGSVKRILSASGNGFLRGIKGTVAGIINTEEKYGTAIETALGAATQNIVVSDETAAKAAIKYLKENRFGRCTFLPLTSVHGRRTDENYSKDAGFEGIACDIVSCDKIYDSIITFLLGRTAVFDNIDNAADAAKRHGYRTRIVTLDGQIINAGGSFTGGSAARSGGILTRKAEIDSLNAKLAERSETYEKWTENIEKAKNNYKIRNDALEEERSLKIWQETEKARLCERMESAKKALESSKFALEKAMDDAEFQKDDVNQNKELLAKSELDLKKIEEEINNNLAIQEKEKAKSEKASAEKENLNSEFSKIRVDEAAKKGSLENLENQIERAESDIENLKRRILEAGEEKKNIQNTASGNSEKIEKFKSEIVQADEKITSLENKSSELRTRREQNEKSIRLLQDSGKETAAAREKTSAAKQRLEEKISEFDEKYDKIINSLLENYSMTRSEARESADKDFDADKTKSELNEIKVQIRRLGSVNVDAVEEEKEVSEKYKFLTAQLEDCQKSKVELEDLIEKLTVEMSRVFSESFEKIRRNFSEIFVELFGGGKADLRLTDPENVLESGIDIIVAPPGKVIKNLIQLSGGEQSFIAVCIYFAILRLRPAPFCILDEIDAALDEVNVSKYAKYLKNFTDTTQFILVTHRRGAMEEAGVLYGVTMQEDGVSRVLKLDQREIPEFNES